MLLSLSLLGLLLLGLLFVGLLLLIINLLVHAHLLLDLLLLGLLHFSLLLLDILLHVSCSPFPKTFFSYLLSLGSAVAAPPSPGLLVVVSLLQPGHTGGN